VAEETALAAVRFCQPNDNHSTVIYSNLCLLYYLIGRVHTASRTWLQFRHFDLTQNYSTYKAQIKKAAQTQPPTQSHSFHPEDIPQNLRSLILTKSSHGLTTDQIRSLDVTMLELWSFDCPFDITNDVV
jgi:hypothetical protein